MSCDRCHVDECDTCRITYQVLPEHTHVEPKRMAVGNLFGREDTIRAQRCVSCRQLVPDDWAKQDPEYSQSGLCQKCQASVFGCTCDNPCCMLTSSDLGVPIYGNPVAYTCGSQHCPEHGGR